MNDTRTILQAPFTSCGILPSKPEIITALFLSKDFDDCINSRCPQHLKEDLKAEIALILCEKDEENLQGLHQRGQLKFFVVRIILNQLHKNGPFYRKYRTVIFGKVTELEAQAMHDILDRQEKENNEDAAMIARNGIHWYNAGIIDLYLKLGSYRAVAKQTGIPFMSVSAAVKQGAKEIKERVIAKRNAGEQWQEVNDQKQIESRAATNGCATPTQPTTCK